MRCIAPFGGKHEFSSALFFSKIHSWERISRFVLLIHAFTSVSKFWCCATHDNFSCYYVTEIFCKQPLTDVSSESESEDIEEAIKSIIQPLSELKFDEGQGSEVYNSKACIRILQPPPLPSPGYFNNCQLKCRSEGWFSFLANGAQANWYLVRILWVKYVETEASLLYPRWTGKLCQPYAVTAQNVFQVWRTVLVAFADLALSNPTWSFSVLK